MANQWISICAKDIENPDCKIFSYEDSETITPRCLQCNEGFYLDNFGHCNQLCSMCEHGKLCPVCKIGSYCQLMGSGAESNVGVCYAVLGSKEIPNCEKYSASIDGVIRCGECKKHFWADHLGQCTNDCDCTIGQICEMCGENSVCQYTNKGQCVDPVHEVPNCKYLKTKSGEYAKTECGKCHDGNSLNPYDNSCTSSCVAVPLTASGICGDHHYCRVKVPKGKKASDFEIANKSLIGTCTPVKIKRLFLDPIKSTGKSSETRTKNCLLYAATDIEFTSCKRCARGFVLNWRNECESNCSRLPVGWGSHLCGPHRFCLKHGYTGWCRPVANHLKVNGCRNYKTMLSAGPLCTYCETGLHLIKELEICSTHCEDCTVGESCDCGDKHQCVFDPFKLTKTCQLIPPDLQVKNCHAYTTSEFIPDGTCTRCAMSNFPTLNTTERRCTPNYTKADFAKPCIGPYYCGGTTSLLGAKKYTCKRLPLIYGKKKPNFPPKKNIRQLLRACLS